MLAKNPNVYRSDSQFHWNNHTFGFFNHLKKYSRSFPWNVGPTFLLGIQRFDIGEAHYFECDFEASNWLSIDDATRQPHSHGCFLLEIEADL